MGLIRTGLSIGTLGAVSDRSRKQRTQSQILAALQGGDVKRAGSRHPYSLGNAFASLQEADAAREVSVTIPEGVVARSVKPGMVLHGTVTARNGKEVTVKVTDMPGFTTFALTCPRKWVR